MSLGASADPAEQAVRVRAFRYLWFGQTASQLGSQVGLVAIPLVAVFVVKAGALEMGLLAAFETLPLLLIALPAGALIDRVDRRRTLILMDISRAAVVGAVVLALLLGAVSLPLLYAAAFLVGALTAIFDIAYQSYVPELVAMDRLVQANQRLEISVSGAQVIGPGLGGLLVGTVGGAVAVGLDAISYLISALALLLTPRPPQRPGRRAEREGSAGPGLLDGLRFVLGEATLRALAASTALFNVASSMILAVFVLFATQEVGLDAAEFGLLYGLGNVGFVVGAAVSARMSGRLGLGATLVTASGLGALATILLPLALGPLAVGFLVAGRFAGAVSAPVFNVNAIALRQARAPAALLGRVNAAFRFIDWGVVPIGSLAGGILGDLLGVRPVLGIAACFGVLSFLLIARSPVRELVSLLPPSSAETSLAPVLEDGAA